MVVESGDDVEMTWSCVYDDLMSCPDDITHQLPTDYYFFDFMKYINIIINIIRLIK